MEIEPKFSAKTQNEKVLLGIIKKNNEISNAKLARITGQQKSSVAYALQGLEKQGLIEVARQGSTTAIGGKPPTLWTIKKDKGNIIGLEINPFEIRMTVVNYNAEIVYQEIKASEGSLNDKSLKAIEEVIDSLISTQNLELDRIIGISIAIPGLVDRNNGHLFYYSDDGIIELNIQETLKQRFNLPVRVVNDANAGALGVKWFSDKDLDIPPNLLFLSINEFYYGIGAGLILNNQLFTGENGTAGESFPRFDELRKIMKEGKEQFGEGAIRLKDIEGESGKIRLIVDQNNREAYKYIQLKLTDLFVQEITAMIFLVNPGLVVIGGDYALNKDLVSDYLVENVTKRCLTAFPRGLTVAKIVFSDHDVFSVSAGATALFIDEIFETGI